VTVYICYIQYYNDVEIMCVKSTERKARLWTKRGTDRFFKEMEIDE